MSRGKLCWYCEERGKSVTLSVGGKYFHPQHYQQYKNVQAYIAAPDTWIKQRLSGEVLKMALYLHQCKENNIRQPSLRQLMKICDLPSIEAVRHWIEILERNGLISYFSTSSVSRFVLLTDKNTVLGMLDRYSFG